ncbi:MAG: putative rane protein [Bacteroidetes bacterium]|nr:putative rane protein [Bacteroidota bacterium]
MKEFLASLVEKIFHPLLMPLYGMALPFLYTDVYFVSISQSFRFFLLIATATFILPITTDIFLRMAKERWPHLSQAVLRLIPYIVSALFTLFLIYFFFQIGVPLWYLGLLLASMVVILATAILNFFWKVSQILLGIGGILGATMCVCYFVKGENPFVLFIFLFLAGGLVGSLQLSSGKYSKIQVYVAFLTGWILSFASVFLFLYLIYLLN